jgi:hypothetical protein
VAGQQEEGDRANALARRTFVVAQSGGPVNSIPERLKPAASEDAVKRRAGFSALLSTFYSPLSRRSRSVTRQTRTVAEDDPKTVWVVRKVIAESLIGTGIKALVEQKVWIPSGHWRPARTGHRPQDAFFGS